MTAEQYGFGGCGNVPVNEFVNISWLLEREKMILTVDGENRIEFTDLPYIRALKQNPDLRIISKVGIGAAWGSCVTVKELNVAEVE